MGLFDKIKDNAKSVSLKALDEAENIDKVDEKPKSTDDSRHRAGVSGSTHHNHESKTHDEKRPEPSTDRSEPGKAPGELGRIPVRNGASFDVTKKVDRPKTDSTDEAPAARPEPKPVSKPKIEEVPEEPVDDDEDLDDEDDDQDEEEVDLEEAKETTSRRSGETLASLAAQLQMSGTEPIFSTEHMNFRTKVYINRIEYMGSFGKIVIPVNKVGWIKIRVAGTGIIVETTTNKRVVMIVKPKDRIRLCDAIMRVQEINIERGKVAAVRGTSGADLERLSVSIDELEKLAKLKDKGIITEKEFLAKKRQLLGV